MENKLYEYARLLVEIGANVQKGQTLIISSPIECAPFARMCASAAYDVDCREVVMNWTDDFLTREKYMRADDAVFDEVPEWKVRFFTDYANQNAAFLHIYASDPENLKGVDPSRPARASMAGGNAMKDYYRMQSASEFAWCIGSIPIKAWAKNVFPHMSCEKAVDALWNAIFDAVRITGDGNAVKRWREHLGKLSERKQKLNEFNFKYLKYSNSLGTDLTIELPENHVWEAGADRSRIGVDFVANMPTEEVFTAPRRDGVNGIVFASRPLVHDGNIIDKFSMTFKDGRITEVHAEKGEDVLHAAVAVDEGASYLGEVALVPYDSPISNSKILFYNTLFDENASCHLAFGEAYPCIKGGAQMSREELLRHGLNDSNTHVDFMVGTSDMSIIGVTHDGREIPVFVNGNFAV